MAKTTRRLLPPPSPLSREAAKYWNDIIGSKRLDAWTKSDLHLAVQLCHDLAGAVSLQADIDEHGAVLVNEASGRRYANPAGNLLHQTKARILSATRGLQIHACATQGKSDHQGNANEKERHLMEEHAGEEDLFPIPGVAN